MTEIVASVRGIQIRKTRVGGWTKTKRGKFLDHLAATGNITAAAKIVGMSTVGAHMLRRRDPVFAELWLTAMRAAYEAVEAELLRRAMGDTAALNPVDVDATRADVPEEAFDVELALRMIALRNRHGSPERRHGGGGRVSKHVPIEEVEAALTKALDNMERQMARQRT